MCMDIDACGHRYISRSICIGIDDDRGAQSYQTKTDDSERDDRTVSETHMTLPPSVHV